MLGPNLPESIILGQDQSVPSTIFIISISNKFGGHLNFETKPAQFRVNIRNF